eukprot:15849048-Heterocapsa_arctica.AAC.1
MSGRRPGTAWGTAMHTRYHAAPSPSPELTEQSIVEDVMFRRDSEVQREADNIDIFLLTIPSHPPLQISVSPRTREE